MNRYELIKIFIFFKILYKKQQFKFVYRMSEDSEFSEEIQIGWINWFCTLEDHHFLVQVDQAYIRNASNLYGLKNRVQRYQQALNMILRHRPPTQAEIQDPKFLQLYQIATQLYGLIHARYIQTPIGLALMRQRYLAGKFGNCPRVMCQNQNAIPVGVSTDCKLSRVKIYCPRCRDIYNPKKKFADVDGAFFGPNFPFLLLMTYPDLGSLFKKQPYVATLFGFKVQQPNPQSVMRLQRLNKIKTIQVPYMFKQEQPSEQPVHLNHQPLVQEPKVVQTTQKNKKNKKKR